MIEPETKIYIDGKIADVVSYTTRKLGDTPTDDLQLTPKKYVTGQISSVISSVNSAFIPKGIGTTKGDVIGFSAASVAGRLGVGTDGQVLTASSVSSLGIKWSTISAFNSNYVFGNMTDVVVAPNGVITNTDFTVTTTFTPTLVKLYFFVQGFQNSTAAYYGAKGIASYTGTTLVGWYAIWTGSDVNLGTPLSGDDGVPALGGFTMLRNDVIITNNPSAGQNIASSVQMQLSVNSVSSTSFVIRARALGGAGNGSNARAKVYYEAWA